MKELAGETAGSVKPLVLCSIGDGAMTEGEVAEALQMAILHQLPIVYLVQDNDWGISATGREMRAMSAYEFAAGFPGLRRMQVDGADFEASHAGSGRGVCARAGPARAGAGARQMPAAGPPHQRRAPRVVPLGPEPPTRRRTRCRACTSGCWRLGVSTDIASWTLRAEARATVRADWAEALAAPDPDPATFADHEFAPPAVTAEAGERAPAGADKALMVDAALHAVDDILREFPEALFYGQDVGGELGGVFREAALLAKKYGDRPGVQHAHSGGLHRGQHGGHGGRGRPAHRRNSVCRLHLAGAEPTGGGAVEILLPDDGQVPDSGPHPRCRLGLTAGAGLTTRAPSKARCSPFGASKWCTPATRPT